jgi:PGF-pre-PGF domain-containing protein
LKKSIASLYEYVPQEEVDNAVGYYLLDTNVMEEDVEKVVIEFEVKKDFLDERRYENVSFYYMGDVEEEDWREGSLSIVKEDSEGIIFQTRTNSLKGFVIVGTKESFLDWLNPFN